MIMKRILIFCTFWFLMISQVSVAQDLSEMYEESIKSVVTIYTTEFKFAEGTINPSQSLGSGVITDTSGLIMTAAHVVETANVILVKLYNGITYEAEIVKSIPVSYTHLTLPTKA